MQYKFLRWENVYLSFSLSSFSWIDFNNLHALLPDKSSYGLTWEILQEFFSLLTDHLQNNNYVFQRILFQIELLCTIDYKMDPFYFDLIT